MTKNINTMACRLTQKKQELIQPKFA